MRLRVFALGLVALLGAGVAVVPSMGSSSVGSTATVSGLESIMWSPDKVTISTAGQVTFEDPSKKIPHGLVWKSGPETPSCSGVPVNSGRTNWSGNCTFTKTGTYQYYCYVHGEMMSGTVYVEAPGTEPPASTSSSTPTATTTETQGASMLMTMPAGAATPSQPMPSAPAPSRDPLSAGALRLRTQQHAHVRGSLDVALAGSSLQITLLAPRAQLSRTLLQRHGTEVLGRLQRHALAAGSLGFEVGLDDLARSALKRRGRLSLTVSIALTPPNGTSVQRSIGVELLH
jgi:plastocyanin